MYNQRQLLSIAKIMRSIEDEDPPLRDYLLLALTDSLMFQNMFCIYNQSANKIEGVFRMNSFVPTSEVIENNVWGASAGRGTFSNSVNKLIRGVGYGSSPTERYIKDGETHETGAFAQTIGEELTLHQGDMRNLDFENEFDAVITDPPYYDNIIYSEVADYFYVWQKILLENEYPGFDREKTHRAE